MKIAHGLMGVLAAMGAVSVTATPAQARGYGPAGCGLGSLIFEPNSGFTQVLAATTNGTFGSQTFGITSGTSNCAGGSGGSASAKAFVETNRVALAKDVARGQGETIDSLSKLAGCRASSAVGSSLQRRFDQIFTGASASNASASDNSSSDSVVSENVIEALRSDAALACSALDAG